jgi:hypothetical protein
MDIWFTKRTGKFAFDVFDHEALEFYLHDIGWHHVSHSTTEVYQMEHDDAAIMVYPDNSVQVTGQNVQYAIDVLEAANGVAHEAQSVDMFARCFAYLRELRDLRISQELAGIEQ